tara:strand:- start:337 stop:759 length:423 start_codon:yes stop_codon:yes gene_type:complete
MDYIILILVIYLIIRIEIKFKRTEPKIDYEDIDIVEIEKPVENKWIENPITKDDFIQKEKDSFNRFKKFSTHNDLIEEGYLERIKNIEKVFDEPDSTEKIRFHGGCHRCVSQKTYGIKRCKGCKYFLADWSLPDLSIEDK